MPREYEPLQRGVDHDESGFPVYDIPIPRRTLEELNELRNNYYEGRRMSNSDYSREAYYGKLADFLSVRAELSSRKSITDGENSFERACDFWGQMALDALRDVKPHLEEATLMEQTEQKGLNLVLLGHLVF